MVINSVLQLLRVWGLPAFEKPMTVFVVNLVVACWACYKECIQRMLFQK